ncbi:unnamed protein product [Microthlaspi erraticum]|uniref:Uncharacterized protein n=1 Tax=Microthlaspi erraticum TaxID=1685480 RepID=A0A6D2IWD0_9BRAS|nr:unnamed protein product [Microthlaspi erraticum]
MTGHLRKDASPLMTLEDAVPRYSPAGDCMKVEDFHSPLRLHVHVSIELGGSARLIARLGIHSLSLDGPTSAGPHARQKMPASSFWTPEDPGTLVSPPSSVKGKTGASCDATGDRPKFVLAKRFVGGSDGLPQTRLRILPE